MYAVKMKINGRILKRTYDNEVKVYSRHDTRAAAEEAVRKIYNDFVADGARPEGTDTDFTVRASAPLARVKLEERFYIGEE